MNTEKPAAETASPTLDDGTTTTAEATPEPAQATATPSRYQPRYTNPRASYKGGKLGNGPNGSRRSMGKR